MKGTPPKKYEQAQQQSNYDYSFERFEEDDMPEQKMGKDSLVEMDIRIRNDQIDNGLDVTATSYQLYKIIQKMDEGNDSGRMIGLFGRWGRGKTHFWKTLKKKLIGHYIPIEFHAWKYQGSEALWAYLFEAFIETYYQKPEKWWYFLEGLLYTKRKIWLNIHLRGLVPFIKPLSVILLGILGVVSMQFQDYMNILGDKNLSMLGLSLATVLGFIVSFSREYGSTAIQVFRNISKDVSFRELLGVQAEIQKELITLLKVWIGKSKRKIIFFVDDLDRCPEDSRLQIIDSIRVMLDDDEISPYVIVITAVDERLLLSSIRKKFEDDVLAREHMDKLFLLSLKLPELNLEQKKEIFQLLTQTKPSTPQAPQDSEDTSSMPSQVRSELNQDEKMVLEDWLNFYENATPRTIKIFYTRYLFAKNLLNLILEKNPQRKSDWMHLEDRHKILSGLILQYTLGDTSQIPEEREALRNHTNTNWVDQKILDDTYTLNITLLDSLLTVVEMVVAY